MNRNLWNFNVLLGFSALFVAGCAAFFSIWGIGLLFSGAAISSMVMASSLELGKLVATSFLYRFWKKSQMMLKSYLCIAVLVLMGITSLGIFGYLSSAYQQSSVKYALLQDQLTTLESQKKQSSVKIDDIKKRVESLSTLRRSQEDRLTQVNTNALLARNPIQFRQVQEQTMELIDQTDKNIKDENEKSKQYFSDIDVVDKKISDIKLGSAETKDIQTFKFVADALGVNLNTVAKWFILVLIVVFDPLAVALVLAYNVAISKEYEIYKSTNVESRPVVKQPEPVVVSEPLVIPPSPEIPTVKQEETVKQEDQNKSVEIPVIEPVVSVPKNIEPVVDTSQENNVRTKLMTGSVVHG